MMCFPVSSLNSIDEKKDREEETHVKGGRKEGKRIYVVSDVSPASCGRNKRWRRDFGLLLGESFSQYRSMGLEMLNI